MRKHYRSDVAQWILFGIFDDFGSGSYSYAYRHEVNCPHCRSKAHPDGAYGAQPNQYICFSCSHRFIAPTVQLEPRKWHERGSNGA